MDIERYLVSWWEALRRMVERGCLDRVRAEGGSRLLADECGEEAEPWLIKPRCRVVNLQHGNSSAPAEPRAAAYSTLQQKWKNLLQQQISSNIVPRKGERPHAVEYTSGMEQHYRQATSTCTPLTHASQRFCNRATGLTCGLHHMGKAGMYSPCFTPSWPCFKVVI